MANLSFPWSKCPSYARYIVALFSYPSPCYDGVWPTGCFNSLSGAFEAKPIGRANILRRGFPGKVFRLARDQACCTAGLEGYRPSYGVFPGAFFAVKAGHVTTSWHILRSGRRARVKVGTEDVSRQVSVR